MNQEILEFYQNKYGKIVSNFNTYYYSIGIEYFPFAEYNPYAGMWLYKIGFNSWFSEKEALRRIQLLVFI